MNITVIFTMVNKAEQPKPDFYHGKQSRTTKTHGKKKTIVRPPAVYRIYIMKI